MGYQRAYKMGWLADSKTRHHCGNLPLCGALNLLAIPVVRNAHVNVMIWLGIGIGIGISAILVGTYFCFVFIYLLNNCHH